MGFERGVESACVKIYTSSEVAIQIAACMHSHPFGADASPILS